MRYAHFAIIAVLATSATAQTDMPAQAARGQELFMKTAKPRPCVSCHVLAGQGTAVGPDLKMWSRFPPRSAAMAITSKLTDKVVEVRPKQGEPFPAMKISEDEKSIRLFNLTVMEPREMARADIAEMAANTKWKHPASQEEYTAEQLADIIAYIRWAGAKDRKPVSPDDIQ
jgi:mono/diheme cytochrome c family protein